MPPLRSKVRRYGERKDATSAVKGETIWGNLLNAYNGEHISIVSSHLPRYSALVDLRVGGRGCCKGNGRVLSTARLFISKITLPSFIAARGMFCLQTCRTNCRISIVFDCASMNSCGP